MNTIESGVSWFSMLVIPDLILRNMALLSNLVLGDSGSADVNVGLFTNHFTPTNRTVLGDFVPLTNVQVPGYGIQTVNFTPENVRKSDGSWEFPNQFSDAIFLSTGTIPVPIAVYGWYAVNDAANKLLGSGTFDAPFVFANLGDGFTLLILPNVIPS